MTNAVDIVMIGGPRNGRMYCVERAKLTGFIGTLGTDARQPEIAYTIDKRQIEGVWYRYALAPDVPTPTDAEVIAAGAIPQWDLNRTQITP